MKNTRQSNNDDNKDEGVEAQPAGFLDGILGAADSAKETAQDAQNPGLGGAINDLVGGVTRAGEAASREATRPGGIVGSIDDLARSATDIAREAGGADASGSSSGGWIGSSAPRNKWDEAPETGVTYDASGNRVDAGGGSLTDSLVGGVTSAAEGAAGAVDATQQDDGEWRSLAGTDAVGSADYQEQLRKAHEAAGTGWYPTETVADADKKDEG